LAKEGVRVGTEGLRAAELIAEEIFVTLFGGLSCLVEEMALFSETGDLLI
jgi:hypothetical protein